jgi:hypothetical protein
MNDMDQVPLTFGQKARLLVECLPAPFMLLALVFTLTVLDDITGAPPPIVLPIFLAVVLAVVGWTALQRLRDFASGVARVQDDVLERAWRSRGSSRPSPFHGRFAQLGTMRLSRKAWAQARSEARYRVAYSPASKIVWSLEPLDAERPY